METNNEICNKCKEDWPKNNLECLNKVCLIPDDYYHIVTIRYQDTTTLKYYKMVAIKGDLLDWLQIENDKLNKNKFGVNYAEWSVVWSNVITKEQYEKYKNKGN